MQIRYLYLKLRGIGQTFDRIPRLPDSVFVERGFVVHLPVVVLVGGIRDVLESRIY